jgi:hypothetical protein
MKFYGVVGFGNSVEKPTGSGIWVDEVVSRTYYGDILRNTRNLRERDQLNDDITLSESISIMADDYAVEHQLEIKYVDKAGTLWTVDTVEDVRPRLILTLGDVYNGEVAEA